MSLCVSLVFLIFSQHKLSYIYVCIISLSLSVQYSVLEFLNTHTHTHTHTHTASSSGSRWASRAATFTSCWLLCPSISSSRAWPWPPSSARCVLQNKKPRQNDSCWMYSTFSFCFALRFVLFLFYFCNFFLGFGWFSYFFFIILFRFVLCSFYFFFPPFLCLNYCS